MFFLSLPTESKGKKTKERRLCNLPLGGEVLLGLLGLVTMVSLTLVLLRVLAVQEILLSMNLLINISDKVRVLGLPSKNLLSLNSP